MTIKNEPMGNGMTDEQSRLCHGTGSQEQTLRCVCRKFPGAHARGGGEIELMEKLNSEQSRQGLSLESRVALPDVPHPSKGAWPCIPAVVTSPLN